MPMRITISYADESHLLDLSKMPISEAEELENLTGWTWTEWMEQFFRDRALAVAFAVYITRKRAGSETSFMDLRETLDLAAVDYELVTDSPDDKPADLSTVGSEDEGPTGLDEERKGDQDSS